MIRTIHSQLELHHHQSNTITSEFMAFIFLAETRTSTRHFSSRRRFSQLYFWICQTNHLLRRHFINDHHWVLYYLPQDFHMRKISRLGKFPSKLYYFQFVHLGTKANVRVYFSLKVLDRRPCK